MEASTSARPFNIPAITVGVVALIAAILGLLYSATTISSAINGAFAELIVEEDLPYLHHAFFIMSAICVACYLILIVGGINLIRSRLGLSRLVTLVLLFELVYLFAAPAIWMSPTIGRSVAAATGIANGGMMIQVVILLPLWGPLLLWWANRKASLASAST